MKQLVFARQLRRKQTDTENLLWSNLRAYRLRGLKFRRQQPVGSYVVDFFCAEKKLIVELDGVQHQDQARYDEARDTWLKAEGYTVLRYWNNEVMGNLKGVLEDISRVASVFAEASPSPQPLSPYVPQGRYPLGRGRGARATQDVEDASSDSPQTRLAPLSLKGRGVGGEGEAAP